MSFSFVSSCARASRMKKDRRLRVTTDHLDNGDNNRRARLQRQRCNNFKIYCNCNRFRLRERFIVCRSHTSRQSFEPQVFQLFSARLLLSFFHIDCIADLARLHGRARARNAFDARLNNGNYKRFTWKNPQFAFTPFK